MNEVFRAKNHQAVRSVAEIELSAKVVRLESRVGELDSLMKQQRMQYARVCKQLQQAARKA